MAQPEAAQSNHPAGKHRYKTVVDGCAMAARFCQSCLTVGEIVQQTYISRRMVDNWTRRERALAHTLKDGLAEVTPAIGHFAVDAASDCGSPERPPVP